jgi:hypothetical protein
MHSFPVNSFSFNPHPRWVAHSASARREQSNAIQVEFANMHPGYEAHSASSAASEHAMQVIE